MITIDELAEKFRALHLRYPLQYASDLVVHLSKIIFDFLLGTPFSKTGSTRKMIGSPRQLENAVPTSKNPHGIWV